MKERPILFNAEMVRAILSGRKTQTRRPLRPQPSEGWTPHSYGDVHKLAKDGEFVMRNGAPFSLGWGVSDWEGGEAIKAPWEVGDLLWVKESFAKTSGGGVLYRADARDNHGYRWHSVEIGDPKKEVKWTPSIHMQRKFSRITLRVKRVWVERVQDISEEDAEAEGIDRHCPYELCNGTGFLPQKHTASEPDHCHCSDLAFSEIFGRAWNSIYGNWAANPWVWCCEFERVAK